MNAWNRLVACSFVAAVVACGDAAVKDEPARNETVAERLDAMEPEDRLAYLRGARRAAPDDATLAFHTGNAYYSLGLATPPEENAQAIAYYDSAVTEYTRAVELDSTYSKAYVNMGLAYEAAAKRPEARGALRRAVEVNPDDVLAHCHLGQLEQTYGDYAEAVRLYRRALALDPNSAQAHYNLGLAFAETKVFKEALVEWTRVIELDPDGELGKTAAENVRIIRQYLEANP
jgi:tetratricopeptide (TPR) repeat protein